MKCTYPKCDCKTVTHTVDNSNDFLGPMFVGEFEQTTYSRIICKYKDYE